MIHLPPDPRRRIRPDWHGPTQPSVPRPGKAALATIECPKCAVRFSTKNGIGMVICQARPQDGPGPYVGPGIGCGWLLRTEPGPFGSLTVDEVMDVSVDPLTALPDQTLIREGLWRLMEYWNRRGLARLKVDRLNGRYTMVDSEGNDVIYDEAAERDRWSYLRSMGLIR